MTIFREAVMYEVFDFFMNIPTWHTRHPHDERRFFTALGKVIEEPGFNPDEMAEYLRQKLNIDINDEANTLNKAIDHFARAAWAVRTYFRTLTSQG